jgi:glycosyltransferase involved in cell wall biosynthesis
MSIRLSLCIATMNRDRFIGETLDTIVPQLGPSIELVIVDGNSSDRTPIIVESYAARCPWIVYRREPLNGGIDQDYDKAVGYARGEYCWLMTDDDLLVPDAVERVLARLESDPSLAVVNAEIRDAGLRNRLSPSFLWETVRASFHDTADEDFFRCCGAVLSFIGSVVIRRAAWMERERERYYGTLFVHFGVIFQDPPLPGVEVLSEPLVVIRYGNAMWTPRAFEIWMFRWPRLVWSFTRFSEAARDAVTPAAPYRSLKKLMWYRR